jgi:hypothetical protein
MGLLEWPGRKTGVPHFLLDGGVTLRSWTNTSAQGSPPAVNQTPDYEDWRLRTALTNFIVAFGARYDGDPRLGFIELGLLGEWGEWHDWPNDQWFASKNVQREILDAYEAAFKQTCLVARYPAGPGHARFTENSSRSFGYHDDSFAWATVHTGKKGDGWFFETLLREAGVLEKWRHQPISLALTLPTTWRLTNVQPGASPVRWQQRARVATLISGSYRVLLRGSNPMAGGKPLRFANQGQDRDRDGWLTLGEVELPK